jgi:hypothetical protein
MHFFPSFVIASFFEIVQKKLDGIHSCCEDISSMTDYSSTIKDYTAIVTNLMNMLRDIKISYVSSSSWSTLQSSSRLFPNANWTKFDEKTIYMGLIHYCNLQNFCPIPDYLLPLCESKPDNIRPENTLDDVILKLKDEKIDINEETFDRMLQLVARQKIQKKAVEEKDEEDTKEEEIQEKKFLNHIKILPADLVTVLQKWHIKKDDDPTDEVFKFFENKLQSVRKQIASFFDTYKPCVSSVNLQIIKPDWRYLIQRFGMIVPSLILNQVDNLKTYCPPSWDLTQEQKKELENQSASEFFRYKPFYENKYLKMILLQIREKTKTLLEIYDVIASHQCSQSKEENVIQETLFLSLLCFYIDWIKEDNEKTGCFTLTEKDTIKMNNENLREFNELISDLLQTFIFEITGEKKEGAILMEKEDRENDAKSILNDIYGNKNLWIE